MTVVYVHALTSAAALGGSRRAVRAAGRRIELIRLGRIAAAVERIGAAPSLSEASLRAQHAIVCRLSRRFDAVLPVRFGASVEPGELRRIVTAREKTLLRALQAVRGRDQMTLRIRAASDRAPAAARPRTGAAYLRARYRAARLVLPPVARGIRRAVAPIVFRERIDAGPGRAQISIHHLVPRGRVRQYQSLVQSVLVNDEAPAVSLSGPWPPFAFAPEILAVRRRPRPAKAARVAVRPARPRTAKKTGKAVATQRRRSRRAGAVSAGPAELAEVESLRAELERLTRQQGPPRWNANPEDVRRAVMKLVLTLVELIRRLLERQAIRRMEAGTLTPDETEAVGQALMRLEETIRELAARFDLVPEDLNLDLGPIGRLM